MKQKTKNKNKDASRAAFSDKAHCLLAVHIPQWPGKPWQKVAQLANPSTKSKAAQGFNSCTLLASASHTSLGSLGLKENFTSHLSPICCLSPSQSLAKYTLDLP